jgi:hypothetical protein
MPHDIPKLLAAIKDATGWTQSELAEQLSGPGKKDRVLQPQISRWLKGADPEVVNYERIVALAERKGVLSDVRSEDVAATLPEPTPRKTVKLKGYVGASGEAVYYRLADDELEEVEAPSGASNDTVAVEVKGKSLGPLLESWLVFYHDVRSPVTDDLIGRLCVVGLADDRILVKRIHREPDGTYSLISNAEKEPPIQRAQIEWAARVTDMRPKW